jgi:hypothetical protein
MGMTELVIGLVGIVVALLGVVVAMYFGRIGTRASKHQEQQDREDREWQLKHETVARQMSRINPHLRVQLHGNTLCTVYADLFPGSQFQRDIEFCIVEADPAYTVFKPRRPTLLELRSPALRETVAKVAAIINALPTDNPQLAHHFGL